MITLWHRHVSNGDEIALEKINFDYSTTAQCDARGNLEKRQSHQQRQFPLPWREAAGNQGMKSGV